MSKQVKSVETMIQVQEGEPPAGQDLGAQLAALSLEISQVEHASEQLVGVIRQVPARIAAGKAAYDRAFAAADDAGMQQAREQIRTANADRDQAAAKLCELADPIERLRDRQKPLYATALENSTAAQEALARARSVERKAMVEIDASSHVGSKITGLLSIVAPYRMAAASEPSPAPVEVEVAKKPQCPFCRIDQDVVSAGPGRWTCTRRHHRRVVFDAAGHAIADGRPG